MRRLRYDLRYAARSLGKAPTFTAVAIVSLGLALALNTSVFALADAVLHPYVPYPDPDRIVTPSFLGGDPKGQLGFDERFRIVRDQMRSYDAISSVTYLRGMMQVGTLAENHLAFAVSPNLFDLLGVRPQFGRGFGAAKADGGDIQAAIISFRLWNRVFNAEPLSDGLRLTFGHATYTVVGVMPRGVHYPFDADIWVPEAAISHASADRRIGPFAVLHLRRGATITSARGELATIVARLTAMYSPRRPIGTRVSALQAYEASPNEFTVITSSFTGGVVTMVLIIACANLGTMMLARGMARRRETAIRIALGANRRAVVGHVLTECTLIVSAGIAIGLLLTLWAIRVIPHFATPYVPTIGDLQPVPSWRVFGFALVASIATIVLAGALPAIHAATTDPAEPMKEGAGTTTGRLRDRYNPLIVLEVALSTALLMCSALFVIKTVRLAAFEFQYAAKRLVVAHLWVTGKQALRDDDVNRFYDDLLVRMRRLPSATSAATSYNRRPDGGLIYAEEDKAGDRWINSQGYFIVSPDYLRTFRIPIVRGRDFEAGDLDGSDGVVIIDERAAARLWPDTPTPVGRMIKLGSKESKHPWLRVVGVAHDVEHGPRQDEDLPPEPRIYVVHPHDTYRVRDVIVQGDGVGGDRGRAALAVAVRREMQAFAPAMPAPNVEPWLANYEGALTAVGFMASLFGAFGMFGIVLCGVGLYGVLSYTVSRRLREFAVRIALGARRRDVARLVVHDATVTSLAGIGIGAFLALYITRSLSDLLANIQYADAIALVAAEAVLLFGATVAALGPMRQAAKADPIEILRAT
jgi:putative ABC transport system permease protein